MSRRLAAWAGMAGPTLFVFVFTLEGWLRSGYNSFSMYVSELSLGSLGSIQIANFLAYSVLFLLFTRGIAAEFKEGKASKAGPLLLTLIGVGLFISGVFVTGAIPANGMQAAVSWHGMIHGLAGAFVFLAMPLSCFVFARRFREDPRWRSLYAWTLAAGVVVTLAVVLMRAGPILQPAGIFDFDAWRGIIQRVAIITHAAWIFTLARHLRYV